MHIYVCDLHRSMYMLGVDLMSQMMKIYSFADFVASTLPWDMVPPYPVSLSATTEDMLLLTIVKQLHGKRVKVAVIGTEESTGWNLYQTLSRQDSLYDTTAYEKGMLIKRIRSYDVVIYLSGGIGVAENSEILPRHLCYDDLVMAPLRIVERMTARQLFVFTSSAAVGEGSGASLFHEEDAPSNWLLDREAEFLRRREYVLQHYCGTEPTAPVMAGLRVGIVLDQRQLYSQQQQQHLKRVDFFPIQMLRNAFIKDYIPLSNPQAHRSLLSVSDFGRALSAIINEPYNMKFRFELFHLQSSSGTIESIAHDLAALTGVHTAHTPEVPSHHSSDQPLDGYSLATTKFESAFDFRFHDSTKSMLRGLIGHIPHSVEPSREFNSQVNEALSGTSCPICGSVHDQHMLVLRSHDLLPQQSSLEKHASEQQRIDYTSSTQKVALERNLSAVNMWHCQQCNHIFMAPLHADVRVEHHSHVQDPFLRNVKGDGGNGESDTLVTEIILTDAVNMISRQHDKSGGNVIEIISALSSPLSSLWKQQLAAIGWNDVMTVTEKDSVPLNLSEMLSSDMDRDKVDLIIAMDSVEYTKHPVTFLSSCASSMHTGSKLYVLLSYLNMFENVTFPVSKSRPLSFFTLQSFALAVKVSKLRIVNDKKVDVVDLSSPTGSTAARLFTLQLATGDRDSKNSFYPDSILTELQTKVETGHATNVFYSRFADTIQRRRSWIWKQLLFFAKKGFEVLAYGDDPWLLSHLFSGHDKRQREAKDVIKFVISNNASAVDAKLDTTTRYMNGLGFPIASLSSVLAGRHGRLTNSTVILALMPLDDYLLHALQQQFPAILDTTVIIAFLPVPKVFKINDVSSTVDVEDHNSQTNAKQNVAEIRRQFRELILAEMPPIAFPFPLNTPPTTTPSAPKRILITHFYNEAFFLPYWIRHHARMFDMAILIDYNSDDNSVDIIRKLAPSTWRVVKTRNKNWEAEDIDREVVWYENQYPQDWKIALCLTEFLVAPNFKQTLEKYENAGKRRGNPYHERMIYSIPTVSVFGDEREALVAVKPLVQQRAVYGHHDADKVTGVESVSMQLINVSPAISMYHRFVHKNMPENLMQYNFGRHYIAHLNGPQVSRDCDPWIKELNDTFIMKYIWSPWPDTKQRKLTLEQKRVQDAALLPNEQWVLYMSLLLSNDTIDVARELMMSGLKLFDMMDMTAVSPDHEVPVNHIFQKSLMHVEHSHGADTDTGTYD